MKKEKLKMYVVRKYVKAVSVQQALKEEKTAPVHEIFIDEKWQEKHLPDAIGFNVTSKTDHDE